MVNNDLGWRDRAIWHERTISKLQNARQKISTGCLCCIACLCKVRAASKLDFLVILPHFSSILLPPFSFLRKAFSCILPFITQISPKCFHFFTISSNFHHKILFPTKIAPKICLFLPPNLPTFSLEP